MVNIMNPKTYAAMNESYNQPAPSYENGNMFTALGESIAGGVVDGGRKLLGGIVGSINEIAPSAIPTATAALAQLSYMGQVGNFQSAMEYLVLSAKFQRIVDDNAVAYGSPLFQRVYINTLSGFLKCENPVFTSTFATSVEESAIEQFMREGMYYE